jgi:hypothetical protein
MLEDAPADMRRKLRCGWSALGLRLGSPDDDRLVLGWAVRLSAPDFALLGADSRLGLLGEVLFARRPGSLLFATFIQLRNPVARAAWVGVAPGHRQVVRNLLDRAAGSV